MHAMRKDTLMETGVMRFVSLSLPDYGKIITAGTVDYEGKNPERSEGGWKHLLFLAVPHVLRFGGYVLR